MLLPGKMEASALKGYINLLLPTSRFIILFPEKGGSLQCLRR